MRYNGDQEFHDTSIDMYDYFRYYGFDSGVSSTEDDDVRRRLDAGEMIIRVSAPDSSAPDSIEWTDIEKIVNAKSGGTGEKLADRLQREYAELATAITVLTGKFARRAEQIAHLERYPNDDPFNDGAILRFEKKFPKCDKRYAYVATRVNNHWFVTGKRSPNDATWDELIEFMGLGVDEVWHVNATEFTRDGSTVQQVERKVIG